MADAQENQRDTLVRLEDLPDFDIAEDEPDPRGWDVVATDGVTIGSVDELIVDTQMSKVRYIDCQVDEDTLGLDEEDRHILIPIGLADLDEDEGHVRVERLSSQEVANLPIFTGLPITEGEEERLRTGFEEKRPEQREATEVEEQRISRSEEEVEIGTREREAGTVEVEKHVEREPVRKEVRTRHDEVEVERRPAGAQAAPEEMRDEEVRIPVREEEVEVRKRPQVKEEVVVRKRPVEEVEEIETERRKERVDTHEERRDRER